MEPLDFNPVISRRADWIDDQEQLARLRHSCDLTANDPMDADSLHFISIWNNDAKACISVSHNGELHHLALPHVSSIEDHAKPLFRFMLKELPRHGYTQIWLQGQTPHQHWLKTFGFQAADGQERLQLFLSPDRTHIASGSDLIVLEKEEAFAEQAAQLINTARKQIIIVTPDLEPSIYNNSTIHDGVLALLKYSDKSRIRILVKDTRYLLEMNHCLIRLYQRSAMQRIEIKRLSEVPDDLTEAYLITDDCGILYRQNENIYRGICYHNNRPRVKNQIEDFEIIWNLAVDDRNIKKLTI